MFETTNALRNYKTAAELGNNLPKSVPFIFISEYTIGTFHPVINE